MTQTKLFIDFITPYRHRVSNNTTNNFTNKRVLEFWGGEGHFPFVLSVYPLAMH